MVDDKGYDRDNQKIVGWSWVREQVFLTTNKLNACESVEKTTAVKRKASMMALVGHNWD